MKYKCAKTVAGVGAALGLAGMASAAGAANAAVGSAATPTWHAVSSLYSTRDAEITAVVATGKSAGWAFDEVGAAAPVALARTGATAWKQVAFPGQKGETVVAAEATSASDVWAFANLANGTSQAVKWNGARWSVVKTFGAYIGGASVLSAGDVWVFGNIYYDPRGALGVYHFNGHTWTRAASTLDGGSATSDKDVWAFTGTTVAHFTGRNWTTTNLAKLLPAKRELNDPRLFSIIALSSRSVYAIGSGSTEDEGGPLVVLHYNGKTWSKVAETAVGDPAQGQVSYDGDGGLWIPAGSSSSQYLLHYADGKLTKAALPKNGGASATAETVSRVPGTAQQLAGGYLPAADGSTHYAIILQYS
jgi:hypothetical protein